MWNGPDLAKPLGDGVREDGARVGDVVLQMRRPVHEVVDALAVAATHFVVERLLHALTQRLLQHALVT